MIKQPWNVQSTSSFVLIALPLPLFLSGSKVMSVRWMQVLPVVQQKYNWYVCCILQACRFPPPLNGYGSGFTAPAWLVGMCQDALFSLPVVVGIWLGPLNSFHLHLGSMKVICFFGRSLPIKVHSIVELQDCQHTPTEMFRSGKNWRTLGTKDRWISAQNSAVFIVLLELCLCLRTFSTCAQQNHVHAWTGTE